MVRFLVLMVSIGIAILASSRGGDARVRLILREGSAQELSINPKLFQCSSDLQCGEGTYCHVPAKSHAHSRCQACRRRNRRCRRDGMCCPGNRCSINVCVPDVDLDPDGDLSPPTKKGQRKRGNQKETSSKGRVGDPCLRSADCSHSLCCARHFWTQLCKPVLMEGQVCTRHRRKGQQGLELFQRCSCGDGLSCRTLQDPNNQPPSLLSTFAASSSQHASPRTVSLKSSLSKTRLHVCQKI